MPIPPVVALLLPGHKILQIAEFLRKTGEPPGFVQIEDWIVNLYNEFYDSASTHCCAAPGRLAFPGLDVDRAAAGLLCYLLRIRSGAELRIHSMRGAVFESFVTAELVKNYRNRGQLPDIHFWRDHRGHEIDLIIESGERLIPVEIKSGETIASDFFEGLNYWKSLAGESEQVALVYGGDNSHRRRNAVVYSWRQWA